MTQKQWEKDEEVLEQKWDKDTWEEKYVVSDEYICSKCASNVREYDDSKPGQAFKCYECANIGRAKEGLIRTKLDGLMRI